MIVDKLTNGNCRNDECISIEEGIGFGRDVPAEILE